MARSIARAWCQWSVCPASGRSWRVCWRSWGPARTSCPASPCRGPAPSVCATVCPPSPRSPPLPLRVSDAGQGLVLVSVFLCVCLQSLPPPPPPCRVGDARQHRDWCLILVCVSVFSLSAMMSAAQQGLVPVSVCLSVFSLFLSLMVSNCWSVGLSIFSLSAPLCHGELCSAAPLCHGECCLTDLC